MCFAQWTCSSQKSTVGSDWPEHDYISKHIFYNRRFGPRAGAGTAVRWTRPTSRPRNLDRTTSRHLTELKPIVYRPHCNCVVYLQPHAYTYIIHIIIILYVYCVRMVWFWFYWQHYNMRLSMWTLLGFSIKDNMRMCVCVCVCVFIHKLYNIIYIRNILLFIRGYRRLRLYHCLRIPTRSSVVYSVL